MVRFAAGHDEDGREDCHRPQHRPYPLGLCRRNDYADDRIFHFHHRGLLSACYVWVLFLRTSRSQVHFLLRSPDSSSRMLLEIGFYDVFLNHPLSVEVRCVESDGVAHHLHELIAIAVVERDDDCLQLAIK